MITKGPTHNVLVKLSLERVSLINFQENIFILGRILSFQRWFRFCPTLRRNLCSISPSGYFDWDFFTISIFPCYLIFIISARNMKVYNLSNVFFCGIILLSKRVPKVLLSSMKSQNLEFKSICEYVLRNSIVEEFSIQCLATINSYSIPRVQQTPF